MKRLYEQNTLSAKNVNTSNRMTKGGIEDLHLFTHTIREPPVVMRSFLIEAIQYHILSARMKNLVHLRKTHNHVCPWVYFFLHWKMSSQTYPHWPTSGEILTKSSAVMWHTNEDTIKSLYLPQREISQTPHVSYCYQWHSL